MHTKCVWKSNSNVSNSNFGSIYDGIICCKTTFKGLWHILRHLIWVWAICKCSFYIFCTNALTTSSQLQTLKFGQAMPQPKIHYRQIMYNIDLININCWFGGLHVVSYVNTGNKYPPPPPYLLTKNWRGVLITCSFTTDHLRTRNQQLMMTGQFCFFFIRWIKMLKVTFV